MHIRFVEDRDIEQIVEIYRYYVEHSIVSFEYTAPTREEFSERISTITKSYPWLVCTEGEKVIGYAYASSHRARAAYKWCVESSIYFDKSYQGRGYGKFLYQSLFDILKRQGYIHVLAGIGLPNIPSVAFHTKMGFEEIGTYKNIGFKQGHWHDTLWMQSRLNELNENPASPLKEYTIV
jgi:phosphinothricin acetyltransferase